MDTTLSANMSKHLITVQETDDLLTAYSLMVKNKIRHLPVMNHQMKIIGILSERDLQRATDSQVFGEGSFKMESCEISSDKLVKDYMSWPIKSVDHKTHLKVICSKMMKEKVSAYLVTNGPEVVGIVTTDDLIKVLNDILPEPGIDLRVNIESFLTNPTVGRIAQTISDMGI